MARIPRVVIGGVPHHVFQCGNRGQKVFLSEADWERYLSLLAEQSAARGLAVQAYCLMPDHVHLVAVPNKAEALAGALKVVHLRYSQALNRRLGVTGVLWQGRFQSCPLDEDYFWAAVRYVERRPVIAGLADRAEDYRWSSAAGHCRRRDDPVLAPLAHARRFRSWAKWLQGREDTERIERLLRCTRTGRPAGGEEFVTRLERRLGRRLRPRPVGRPRKNTPTGRKP